MKKTVIITMVSLLLIGCGGLDSTQIISHPGEVPPSAQFDVVLADIFTLLDTGRTITNQVVRDSLHLVVGMPDSWDVVAASFAFSSDITTSQILAFITNPAEKGVFEGSLEQVKSTALPMTIDVALPEKISNDTIVAHNQTSDTDIGVVTNSIAKWKGFSAPVNIVMEKDVKPDTLFPYDSAVTFAVKAGIIDESAAATAVSLKEYISDTIGIKMVPMVLFLKVQPGAIEKRDTLYYFSKTGMMNPQPSALVNLIATFYPDKAAESAALESGDMTYIPVNVSNAAGIKSGTLLPSNQHYSGIRVTSDFSGTWVSITANEVNGIPSAVSLYSLNGDLIASLPGNNSGSILWNCRDRRGNRVKAGTYIATLSESRSQGRTSAIITIAR